MITGEKILNYNREYLTNRAIYHACFLQIGLKRLEELKIEGIRTELLRKYFISNLNFKVIKGIDLDVLKILSEVESYKKDIKGDENEERVMKIWEICESFKKLEEFINIIQKEKGEEYLQEFYPVIQSILEYDLEEATIPILTKLMCDPEESITEIRALEKTYHLNQSEEENMTKRILWAIPEPCYLHRIIESYLKQIYDSYFIYDLNLDMKKNLSPSDPNYASIIVEKMKELECRVVAVPKDLDNEVINQIMIALENEEVSIIRPVEESNLPLYESIESIESVTVIKKTIEWRAKTQLLLSF